MQESVVPEHVEGRAAPASKKIRSTLYLSHTCHAEYHHDMHVSAFSANKKEVWRALKGM